MNDEQKAALAKVPEVTLIFWIIKIFATTLGETGGDALSMSLNQIRARQFHPVIYWFTIIATTTVGTTMADFTDRSLHIGYAGGASLLLMLLLGSLMAWKVTLGSVAVGSVSSPKSEIFYWVTILFSQTLGTALGDWVADSDGLGYLYSAGIFGTLLALVALANFYTRISKPALFWAAFILTRPLGAVVGDFLDKPFDHGGLALSRVAASATLLLLISFFIFAFPHRAAKRAH